MARPNVGELAEVLAAVVVLVEVAVGGGANERAPAGVTSNPINSAAMNNVAPVRRR